MFAFEQMADRQDRRLHIVEGENTVDAFRDALAGIVQQDRPGQRPQQGAQFLFGESADQQIGGGIGFPRLRKHSEEFPVSSVGHPDHAFVAAGGQQTDDLQHQFGMKTGDAAVEFADDDLNGPDMEFFMPFGFASRVESRQITQFRGGGEDPSAGLFRYGRQLAQRPRNRHRADPAFGGDPVQGNIVFAAAFHPASLLFGKNTMFLKKNK